MTTTTNWDGDTVEIDETLIASTLASQDNDLNDEHNLKYGITYDRWGTLHGTYTVTSSGETVDWHAKVRLGKAPVEPVELETGALA